MTFLLIPAVFLLALSLIVCRRSWSAVTTIFKHTNYKTRCNYFLSTLVEFFRPLLAPALWIVVALLRGECYVCIRVGSGKECISDVQKVSNALRICVVYSSDLNSERSSKDNLLFIHCYYRRNPKLNKLYLYWIALSVLNCSS